MPPVIVKLPSVAVLMPPSWITPAYTSLVRLALVMMSVLLPKATVSYDPEATDAFSPTTEVLVLTPVISNFAVDPEVPLKMTSLLELIVPEPVKANIPPLIVVVPV